MLNSDGLEKTEGMESVKRDSLGFATAGDLGIILDTYCKFSERVRAANSLKLLVRN
jgi:hypothetical protein